VNDVHTTNHETPAATLQIGGEDRYIHSAVWDNLVESDADIAGMIAYGLYQQRKREWISDCLEKNGALPCKDEVKNHSNGYKTSALKALRDQADGILFQFGEEYADSKLSELQRKAFNSRAIAEISSAKEDLDKIYRKIVETSGYVHHMKTHIAGFFALAALIALVTVLVQYEKSPGEFLKMFSGYGEHEATTSQHNSAASTPSTGATPDVPARWPQP
jgi:hypothetical protein